jgi:hypothetical protein
LQEQSFKHKWIDNEDADSFVFALMCCHIIFIGHSYVEAQRIKMMKLSLEFFFMQRMFYAKSLQEIGCCLNLGTKSNTGSGA